MRWGQIYGREVITVAIFYWIGITESTVKYKFKHKLFDKLNQLSYKLRKTKNIYQSSAIFTDE